ncbi:response regulator transcription factor [Brevibacillus migulae]|uniref:response regulator transcription factor n=1 Tax=Brevibacillus migulae TaxID=1644114 RepID=UPI00106E4E99|nr:response regulator [Brevibacillus migulae]
MYSLLIVDDERWVRASLKKIVERTELPFHVIHEAAHGLEAMDWLKSQRVDVMITDVRMPVMDGLQLVQSIQEEHVETEIIIVSGHDEFHYAQRALRMGVRDYLLKPVLVEDMAKCLQKINHALESRKMRAEEKEYAAPPFEGTINGNERSTIEQVISYIKSKMPGEVTLQETASAVHLNPSYLSHLFKQQTKTNFIDFVLKLRMEEAKKLLSCTSLRISEIAERLQYNDTSYFSHSFKRMVGKTPSEFRKELIR